MKKILSVVKRFVLSTFILYGYNLIATKFNLIIPINVFTVSLVGGLGIPALFALILLKIVAF